MTLRDEILDRAKIVVGQERNKQYGEPDENFRYIAALWSVYLKEQLSKAFPESVKEIINLDNLITAVDVATMMELLKIGRGNDSEDSWLDRIGFAACGYETRFKGEKQTMAEVVAKQNYVDALAHSVLRGPGEIIGR